MSLPSLSGAPHWRRRLSCCALAALLPAFPLAAAQYAPLQEQTPVAAPALAKQPGGPDLLAAHGKPVVVNFWATWCEPCREEMPALDQFRRQHPEVQVLTVAVGDSRNEVARFMDDNLLDLPVIHDPEQLQSRAWNVRILPTTVVLDADHRVRFRAVGALDWHAKPVSAVLERMRASGAHP